MDRARRFESILFDRPWLDAELEGREVPPFFSDLNLDQVFASLVAGREEYDLAPFFRVPLDDVEAITYRQDVMRDLEGEALRAHIEAFAREMRAMREHIAQAEKMYYEYQKASWFLDAVGIYCDAVGGLAAALPLVQLRSSGFLAFREYLAMYVDSAAFRSLVAETRKLKDDLSAVSYCVHIRGKRVTVRKYAGEPDYSAAVETTFQKFKQGAVKDYRVAFHDPPGMNHVEAAVLDLVARLHPDIFVALRDYCARRRNYLDETIRRFDREVQFYMAYLQFIERLKLAGLRFCYPRVSDRSKEVYAFDTFDLALANRLVHDRAAVVCNDFWLRERERIFVVSGPNQGGKTTFARTFGQLHYLARLGYPVPGREARLFLCDFLFTHFEKEEHIENLRGKLQDELVRIHEILRQATANSIVIMNESFSSTTLQDALFLGREVLGQIIARDMLCVYVTFIDELASLGDATVSMVSTVAPENPAVRTFKVVRQRADGLAYAATIAAKYGLTYEAIKRRMAR